MTFGVTVQAHTEFLRSKTHLRQQGAQQRILTAVKTSNLGILTLAGDLPDFVNTD
jgi:hypothetical protein